METPWWELMVRAFVVYAFLLCLFRLTGKRQVGQLAPFDLVLLLILSNAVQNSMNAGDNSLLAGLILAASLIGLNHGMGYLSYRFPRVEVFLEGRPEVLIASGKVYHDVLRRHQISPLELETAVRNGGCESIADVRLAILENNGHVSVIQSAPRS